MDAKKETHKLRNFLELQNDKNKLFLPFLLFNKFLKMRNLLNKRIIRSVNVILRARKMHTKMYH